MHFRFNVDARTSILAQRFYTLWAGSRQRKSCVQNGFYNRPYKPRKTIVEGPDLHCEAGKFLAKMSRSHPSQKKLGTGSYWPIATSGETPSTGVALCSNRIKMADPGCRLRKSPVPPMLLHSLVRKRTWQTIRNRVLDCLRELPGSSGS